MNRLFRILLDAAAADGNGPAVTPPAAPPPQPSAPPAAPANPPPVAAGVMAGTISERETDLQAQIDVLKAERDNFSGRNKKLETDISHLQDQLSALKNPPAPPTPTPAPKPERERAWHETFLGSPDEEGA